MSEVSCYSMHLYCDHPQCPGPKMTLGPNGLPIALIDEYEGRNRSECVAQARSSGWIFHRDGRLTCPKCSRGEDNMTFTWKLSQDKCPDCKTRLNRVGVLFKGGSQRKVKVSHKKMVLGKEARFIHCLNCRRDLKANDDIKQVNES